MATVALLLATAAVAAMPAASAPNLLLVTIDTLRADHLHAYGYAAIETAATDRLAREGVLVEDATVHVPQTRPSHASILTGRLPYEHGIRDNFSPPLDARHLTLASVLRSRGYDTGAFIGSVILSRGSGLWRGFGTYDDPFSGTGGTRVAGEERPAKAVVEAALPWLGRKRVKPFFAWIHLYDPHAPYEPPEPFAGRYAGRPYDGEVAYADSQVARLLEFLDTRKLRERTLVVVTSDHGEGLGDHDEEEHLMFLYDATLRVPLLLSWPGVLPAGTRVAGQFRAVDLVPTLLELLGALPVPTSGTSQAKALKAGARIADNESYAESLYGEIHFGYAPLRALRSEGWKYVEAPRAELFNLREDPGETKNLLGARAQMAERLHARLASYGVGQRTRPSVVAPDAGTMEKLAALGYVGTTSRRGGVVQGADPKDKIEEFQSFNRDSRKATRLFQQGDVDGAVAVLRRLAGSEILSLEVQYLLGKGLIRQKRYAEAARALEEARALVPSWSPTYLELGRAYFEMGEPAKAIAALDQGLRVDPANAALHQTKGIVLMKSGDLPGARAVLERARSLAPREPSLRLTLSAVLRDLGQRPAAIAELREGVRVAPASADLWNALGVLLAAAGREEEARSAFRSGLRARPEDPELLFNLGDSLVRAGRAGEAVPVLEKLVAVAPSFPDAASALERARREAQPIPGHIHLHLIRVADRAQAEAAARRIAGGEDFGAVARSVSVDPSAARGGDLGLVRSDDLAEPLRSAARALGPGQVSPALEVAEGYVLLKRE